MKQRFIFVGGADRSGTTLLQRILTAHSQIGGGPQLSGVGYNLTYDLFSLYGKILDGYDRNKTSFFADKETIRKNFEEFYFSFFRKAGENNWRFISEKTTKNIEVAEILLEFFEDAVFVNIYRDGRDVLSSHFEVAGRNGADKKAQPNAGLVCYKWNEAIRTMERMNRDPVLSKRFFSLRFEDMICEPEVALKKLFDFIGLEFEPHLLQPEKIENSAGLADGIWHLESDFKQTFNRSKIGKWKKHLSLKNKVKANLLMRDNLLRLGYELSPLYSAWKK
jgi:hypothetical protein